jgi:glycosyltransferase involved in cell wall biosynthesis
MLGWEFPPHLSGGLGTACHGLTRGLRQEGVDVSFVLPRVLGDERARHVRLVGAERWLVEEDGRTLAVDSLLSPYLSSGEYAGRRRQLAGARPAAVPGRAVALSRGPPGRDPYGADLHQEVGRFARAASAVAASVPHDLVHAHDWMTFPAGMAAARARGVPLVVHVHACERDRNPTRPDPRIRDVEREGIARADRVVAVSRYAARTLSREYRVEARRLRVVHNAVDRPAGRAPSRRGRRRGPPVVLYLGRVTGQKGPGTFLDAAERVLRRAPSVRFVMAGSGDLLPAMVERAARPGLAESVRFTGFLHGAEVTRAYDLADVFVLPSVSEPFGIAPLEALARGVPVILSRKSGVAEVVQSAPRVSPGRPAALARAILALLRSPATARWLAREGRREVRALTWRRQARRLRAVYEEVL